MREHTEADWERVRAVISSDPLLHPPTAADRAVVTACGGVVDEQIAGAR